MSDTNYQYDEGVVLRHPTGDRERMSLGAAVAIIMNMPVSSALQSAIFLSNEVVFKYEDIRRIYERLDFPRKG